jgi:ribosomal-protein-alanine N-acetyltransferase
MSLSRTKDRVTLRPMTNADLDQVEAIDRISFPKPWPRNAFRNELMRKSRSICWVAEWHAADSSPIVVASIVIWLVVDEAHIGTLAVTPEYRRCGIAQSLLARALIECTQRGAKVALLEVRESNLAAQSLYRRFGFQPVGLRREYYKDNHEDAILMTLASMDSEKLSELAGIG